VGFLLDAKLAARLRERAVNAGGRTVDDDQAGPVPGQKPVDDLLREVGGIPLAIPAHDDSHTGILADICSSDQ
jgi:hypothetical protein